METLVANGPALLFYLFAGLALISAILVISLRNPMYCAIALLVTFLAVAALFVLRYAEFVAVVQIFVYGGGVMVLFLFVIMLVNLHRLREVQMFGVHWPMGVVIGFLVFALIAFVVMTTAFGPANPNPDQFVSVDGEVLGNAEAVAWKLYREYLLPFEIASLFLLVAMVGAVILARKE